MARNAGAALTAITPAAMLPDQPIRTATPARAEISAWPANVNFLGAQWSPTIASFHCADLTNTSAIDSEDTNGPGAGTPDDRIVLRFRSSGFRTRALVEPYVAKSAAATGTAWVRSIGGADSDSVAAATAWGWGTLGVDLSGSNARDIICVGMEKTAGDAGTKIYLRYLHVALEPHGNPLPVGEDANGFIAVDDSRMAADQPLSAQFVQQVSDSAEALRDGWCYPVFGWAEDMAASSGDWAISASASSGYTVVWDGVHWTPSAIADTDRQSSQVEALEYSILTECSAAIVGTPTIRVSTTYDGMSREVIDSNEHTIANVSGTSFWTTPANWHDDELIVDPLRAARLRFELDPDGANSIRIASICVWAKAR